MYLVVFVVFFLFCSMSFSTLILLVGSFDCKNCLPYNQYCVGGDVKHCSLTHSLTFATVILFDVLCLCAGFMNK